jgi:hypothetical protein
MDKLSAKGKQQIEEYFSKNPAVGLFPTKEFIDFCLDSVSWEFLDVYKYTIGFLNETEYELNQYKIINQSLQKIWDIYHAEYLAKAQLEIAEKNQQKLNRILALLDNIKN